MSPARFLGVVKVAFEVYFKNPLCPGYVMEAKLRMVVETNPQIARCSPSAHCWKTR